MRNWKRWRPNAGSWAVLTHTAIGDVSDAPSVYRMVESGIEALGKIDVLVSNVAIRPHKPVLDVSDEEWRHVLGVNLDSAFYLCKAETDNQPKTPLSR